MKKQVMMSQKALENINMIKNVIESLNEQIEDTKNIDENKRLNERLDFMKSQLNDLQESHEKFLKNDSPYYETGTLEFYKNEFYELRYTELDYKFVSNVINCIESEHIKNKLSAIKNIVKAYKIRDGELTKILMQEKP